MKKQVFNRPDEETVKILLVKNPDNAAGTILRLAWLVGLMREEIVTLTWDNVDFAGSLVRLPDRIVPISEEMHQFLSGLYEQKRCYSNYVVISDRDHKPLASQSVSRIARDVLDTVGQYNIRLLDLRHDFVVRQLEKHDWQYVSRTCGIEAAAMSQHFGKYIPEKRISTRIRKKQDEPIDEFKLWKLLQEEGASPEALAICLSWQMGLRLDEIVNLKWKQINLSENQLFVSGKIIPITNKICRILSELQQKYDLISDYVLISPRAHRKFEKSRLSKLVRAVLVRGEMDNISLRDLRMDYNIRIVGENAILDHIKKNGKITREEAMSLLNVSHTNAYSRLKNMIRQGTLARIGTKYYLSTMVVPPERQNEAIRDYLTKEGFAYRQDIAHLLRIEPRQCYPILKKLVISGDIGLDKQRYFLCKSCLAS